MRSSLGLKMAMFWSVLTFSAAVGPAPVCAADELPHFLSPKDSDTYRQILLYRKMVRLKQLQC